MGLLDGMFDSADGRLGLGLLAAGSARPDGAGAGQRLMEAIGSVDQWKQQQALAKRQAMQDQMMQMQMDAHKQQLLEQQKIQALLPQFSQPAVGVNGDGFGPTRPAQFDREGYASALEAINPMQGLQYAAGIQKQAPKMTVVAPGASLVNESTGRASFTAPKEASKPSALQEYEYAKEQGYKGTYLDFQIAQKKAGAPSVSVNTSDPTAMAKAGMDFQDKYRSATKDSFSRAQAYEAMVEASKNPSAKGDLTMVYSMVKALDPTSVVREGEISLLNANRSIPDSIKGYAQRLATGQSLLPKEREDMLNQAKNLIETDYRRSRNDVKAYRDNATRLTLDPELYAPDPYTNYEKSKQPKAEQRANVVNELPKTAPVGSRARDTVTGKVMRFDGMKWKAE